MCFENMILLSANYSIIWIYHNTFYQMTYYQISNFQICGRKIIIVINICISQRLARK